MLTLPSAVRIFVAAELVDLRRGFDGLAAATRSVIRESQSSVADHDLWRAERPSAAVRGFRRFRPVLARHI